MKKAVMYGAGNIGRGFIGLTLCKAGYSVVFIDINKTVIAALNEQKSYPVDIVSSQGKQREWAQNVSGVDGGDVAAAADEIASCDIMATAVGVNVLKFIAPVLLEGIRRRWQTGNTKPLNIIICENRIDADAFLRDLVEQGMTESEKERLSREVGFVMASIGRMVPLMTEEQRAENPLLVLVEPYDNLPVDKDAFVGEIPAIGNLSPSSPFSYVVSKKLFVHNLGHAVCAYLGQHFGYRYVYEAMGDPWIYLCVQNAMLESCCALSARYSAAGVTMDSLVRHANDLTYRFQNRALLDTNERVGADPVRKLSSNDRLVGAARFAIAQGGMPVFIGLGIACGLIKLAQVQSTGAGAGDVLLREETTPQHLQLIAIVEKFSELLEKGASAQELFAEAESIRARSLHPHP